ncbi:MAG: hypothetical protein EHM93_08180 [Bacteroidales bacterium]|nr:MAG: hypothetical protein EHM93_08180 [Bacteroidales bacterium]
MKKENAQIGFALLGIKTEQFAVFEENYNPKQETGLGLEIQYKINKSNNQIGVFLGFEFIQSKKVFIKVIVSCHFKIEENSWKSFLQEKETKLVVPRGFLEHLAMIATGTTRGVLFAKTEGTEFSKFIIPTLNVAKMIKEDAIFEIGNE